MSITEKCGSGIWLALLPALMLATSCTPPGPRAVLRGDRLVREGRHSEAVRILEQAVVAMPREARAWNLLGLAHHGAGQTDPAAKAYRQALQLNRNLAVAHFNLGSLLLETGDASGAAASLTSYCGLQSNDPTGWTRLGTAQLQARLSEAAERSFQQALRLQPRSAEALNGVGMALVQKRRYAEAQRQFHQASQQDASYAPAMLNSAIVSQQYLNNKPLALEKYRGYLALSKAPQRAAVEQTARQLETELSPAARAPAPAVTSPLLASKSGESAPASGRSTNPAVAKASPPGNSTPAPSPTPPSTPRPTAAVTNTNRTAASSSPPVRSNAPVARPAQPPATETVRLETEPAPQPARDAAPLTVASLPPANPQPSTPSPRAEERAGNQLPATNSGTAKQRTPFVQRLNPVSWFKSKDREPSSGANPSVAVVAARPGTASDSGADSKASGLRSGIPRYSYSTPQNLQPGDREAATQHFQEGVRFQERNRLADAIDSYQKAVTVDASFFEARFNLGMAAFEAGRLPQSLQAYESAVRLRPDSANARYNFAVLLDRAGYPLDAAVELERLLAQHPAEARGHLAVATLYARKLGDPKAARSHYQTLLQLEPQHPQATEVRFWLEANP